jgi:hypothetical protein
MPELLNITDEEPAQAICSMVAEIEAKLQFKHGNDMPFNDWVASS